MFEVYCPFSGEIIKQTKMYWWAKVVSYWYNGSKIRLANRRRSWGYNPYLKLYKGE